MPWLGTIIPNGYFNLRLKKRTGSKNSRMAERGIISS